MLLINLKENDTIDKALKKYKKKFEKTGVVKELRERDNSSLNHLLKNERWLSKLDTSSLLITLNKGYCN